MAHHNESIEVTVHFMAAEEPFRCEASRHETIGDFKPRVLAAFGLTEGPTPDGNVTDYVLYHDKAPLDNPSQTLGELAGEHRSLRLKLSQQITQGGCCGTV
jgi:hypothetical protein